MHVVSCHFAIIDAASSTHCRRSGDLGHSDLSPQWCARSGNKSAFCCDGCDRIPSEDRAPKMGDMGAGFHLPPARFSSRKPDTFLDFQGRILRPSQFRSCTNDHRRREKMTFDLLQIIL